VVVLREERLVGGSLDQSLIVVRVTTSNYLVIKRRMRDACVQVLVSWCQWSFSTCARHFVPDL